MIPANFVGACHLFKAKNRSAISVQGSIPGDRLEATTGKVSVSAVECPTHVRFGSKADIRAAKSHVRFTLRKRTFAVQLGMSAKGQKRTFKSSALAKRKTPGHCPRLRCLRGLRVTVLVEAIIYPQLSYRNSLADFHAWDLDWHTAKCPDQCHRTCTKIVVVEFGFHRPVIPKRPFNAGTDGPARSGLAGRRLFEEHGDRKRIFVVSPGRTALAVDQPAIPRPAQPTRCARNPIRFSGCRSGDSYYRLGYVPLMSAADPSPSMPITQLPPNWRLQPT
jgi:hypothetical protein